MQVIELSLKGLSLIANDRESTKARLQVYDGEKRAETGEFPTVIPFPSISSLFNKPPEKEQKETLPEKTESVQTEITEQDNKITLKFTKQEISKMATTFKKAFIANGLVAHVTKRESGKNSVCYEIRYRANGYKIETSSTDLQKAKKKFLEMTTATNIEKYRVSGSRQQTVPTNFKKFALFYFENYRKKKVSEQTYTCDFNRLNRHILPKLARYDLNSILPNDCQSLLDKLMQQDKCKTAVEIYNILSCIFKCAIAFDVLKKNPLDVVIKPTYDQEHGKALSREEVYTLLQNATDSKYSVHIAIALYCGLRPNELTTAEIDGEFIKAVNSKRHKKDKSKIEYKYIPISEQLKPFIIDGIPPTPNLNLLRKYIASILPGHILYDCRTTFYSRCKECGVDQRALDEYMGHSLGKIGNAYTDLSKEFLLQEGRKIYY